jgi:hypothetical protein
MSCRYCGYEAGHAKECPAYQPGAKIEKSKSGGEVRYSGTEFEYDLFGQADIRNPEYVKALRAAGADERTGYLPFGKAVDLTKRFQPGDPSNPKKEYLRDLLFAVQEKLGVDPEDEPDSVRAFTAVGTPLDKFHGVDAFVSKKGERGDVLVTLDATLRPEKLNEGWKADLMIGDLPSVEDDEDGYLAAIDDMADKIASKIREKERPKAA